MSKTKYYHASPKNFRHGDILVGGHDGGAGYAHDNVCLTNSPVAHGSIAGRITNDWAVYEVEPLYSVKFVEGNGEYQTRAARIIRRVGNASSILKNARRNSRASSRSPRKGSWVQPTYSRNIWIAG